MTFSNIRTTAFAVLITSCSAVSGSLLGATVPAATAPTITYTASGTFASPAANGNDTLKLAGEPFSVTIAVSAATKPVKTGRNWALYTKLKLTGTVHSGLLGPSPISITSGAASVQQFIDPGQPDLFVMAAPLKVVGISLTIKANITLPAGTLSKPLLQPFKAVTLTAADATMVYADGTANTTLGIASGTLTAVASSGAKVAATGEQNIVLLHPGAVQAVTLHADGSQAVASAVSQPVDMGQLSDAITLRMYASGVSDGSEVSVRIAGEEVPVLYAGPSGHYAGLDEVFVQLPRTLAGRGATEALLTVDGQSSNSLPLYIQ